MDFSGASSLILCRFHSAFAFFVSFICLFLRIFFLVVYLFTIWFSNVSCLIFVLQCFSELSIFLDLLCFLPSFRPAFIWGRLFIITYFVHVRGHVFVLSRFLFLFRSDLSFVTFLLLCVLHCVSCFAVSFVAVFLFCFFSLFFYSASCLHLVLYLFTSNLSGCFRSSLGTIL